MVSKVAMITKKGSSLGVSLTDVCKKLGVNEGDMVYITVRRIEVISEDDKEITMEVKG